VITIETTGLVLTFDINGVGAYGKFKAERTAVKACVLPFYVFWFGGHRQF